MFPSFWVRRAFSMGALLAALFAAPALPAQPVSQPPLSSATSTNPVADDAFHQGVAALDAKEWDRAQAAFSFVISLDPKFAPAHLGLGKALSELGNYSDAADSFSSALRQDPTLADAYHGRGEAFRRLGTDPAQAKQDLDYAVLWAPNDPDYNFSQGRFYIELGNVEAGIKILDRVINELNPNHADAYDVRSQAEGYLGLADAAIADARRAIELNGDDETFYFNLGRQLAADKRYDEAITAYTDAYSKGEEKVQTKERTASYVEALLGRLQVHLQMADEAEDDTLRNPLYLEALADADLALQTSPQAQSVHYYRGVILRLLDRYDDAVKAFTSTLQLLPSVSEQPDAPQAVLALRTNAMLRRGIVRYQQGEFDLALADFEGVISDNFQDVRAYLWKGLTHARTGDYYQAVLAYSLGIEQNQRYQPLYENRGLAYLQLEQYAKAARDFNEVLRLDPTSANAFYKRGVAQAMLGKWDQAASSYRDAIRYNPELAVAHRQLARAYDRLGDARAAAQQRAMADQIKSPPEG